MTCRTLQPTDLEKRLFDLTALILVVEMCAVGRLGGLARLNTVMAVHQSRHIHSLQYAPERLDLECLATAYRSLLTLLT